MHRSFNYLRSIGKNITIMAAAMRGPWNIESCFSPDPSYPATFTTIESIMEDYDAQKRAFDPSLHQPVPDEILKQLGNSELFRQAYDQKALAFKNVGDLSLIHI